MSILLNKVPRFFAWLLNALCAQKFANEIQGDLEEAFHTNTTKYGRFRARYIYSIEVLRLIRPSVLGETRLTHIINNSMINNYIKITFRNLRKNKSYAIINTICMGTALACCLVSYVNYNYHTTYDEFHSKANQLYRINFKLQQPEYYSDYAYIPTPMATELENLTYIENASIYNHENGSIRINQDLIAFNLAYVNQPYFTMFDLGLLHGSLARLDFNDVILSDKIAFVLFGETDVIGRNLLFLNGNEEFEFTVQAVYKAWPGNSSFQQDAFALDRGVSNNWNDLTTAFIHIPDAKNVEAVEKQLNRSVEASNVYRETALIDHYYLDNLVGMAYKSVQNDVASNLKGSWPLPAIIVPAIFASLILLLACFTFANTSIASSAQRLKEIGVRKVVGGRTHQLIVQFLIENTILCALSIIIAIPLANVLLNQFNSMVPADYLKLSYDLHLNGLLFIFSIVLISGILSGMYPAIYLSSFRPASILKGDLRYGKIGRLSKILLAVQMTFAITAIVASVIFIQNAKYQRDFELGFDIDETVVVRLNGNRFNEMKNLIRQSSRIKSITGGAEHIARRYYIDTVAYLGKKIGYAGTDVSEGYIETMELEIIAGRDFNPDLASDFLEGVIINESFVEWMGWKNPIGKKLVYKDSLNYFVTGVVKNFFFNSFESEIQPFLFRFQKPEDNRYLVVKTNPQDIDYVIEELKLAWKTIYNDHDYDIKPGSHAKGQHAAPNMMILKFLLFLGGVATILSLIGFYALVSLNMEGRTKELGIRKILGATRLNIAAILNKTYIYILLGGIILGSIIAGTLIPLLLDSIWAHHIGMNPGIFIISSTVLVLGCFLTVGLRVLSLTATNPTELLRSE